MNKIEAPHDYAAEARETLSQLDGMKATAVATAIFIQAAGLHLPEASAVVAAGIAQQVTGIEQWLQAVRYTGVLRVGKNSPAQDK